MEIPPGRSLLRIYDPTDHDTSELTFRRYGPKARFDHHRWAPDYVPQVDPVRGVWYAASFLDLACAIVEVFGDTGIVVLQPFRLARPTITASLRLLDLRRSGAMAAGTTAELAKTGDAALTWQWAQYFYSEPVYDTIDGIAYLGSHNDGEAVVLFERAAKHLDCFDCSVPLDHPDLRDPLLEIVSDHNLALSLTPPDS